MAIDGLSSISGSLSLGPAKKPVSRQTGVGDENDFGSVLASLASATTQSLNQAEQASASALSGKSSIHQVVETVMQAEQSLQTMIAIRDKTVAAIQEITRMAI